jgi:DNA processing protein
VGDLRSAAGLLELMRQPGVGPGTAIALAEHFSTGEALAASSPAERRAVAGARGEDLDLAGVEATRIEAGADGVVGYFDEAFPPRLRSIPSPPAVLWVRGTLPDPAVPAVAVVGTRGPTAWGVRVAEGAVEVLEGTGTVIVSGLARGVDGIAHRRALAVGLPTTAILGSGVDAPTPREHVSLAHEILDAGGALVAEVPPGTSPSARTLVARNRLQSGLSDAVVVAQCGLDSGTLHTARFAMLQGRRLVVPAPAGSYTEEPESAGNLALIRGDDPRTVKASPAEARRLAERERFVDYAPTNMSELRAVLRGGVRASSVAEEHPAAEQLTFGG